MRIQYTFSNQIFVNETPNEQPEQQPGSIMQDSQAKGNDSNLIEDMLFNPRGIGQSSSLGKRYLSPEDIQNITPEQLAEMERRKRMADAGLKAGAELAGAVNDLLPTNKGAALTGAGGLAISEGAQEAVERGTTAPKEEENAEEAAGQSGKSAATNGTPKDEEAAENEAKPPSETPKPKMDPGFRMNPDYIGIIDINPDDLQKRTSTREPEPPKNDRPQKPVRSYVGPSRASDAAKVDRDMDSRGDMEEMQKYIRSQRLLR